MHIGFYPKASEKWRAKIQQQVATSARWFKCLTQASEKFASRLASFHQSSGRLVIGMGVGPPICSGSGLSGLPLRGMALHGPIAGFASRNSAREREHARPS